MATTETMGWNDAIEQDNGGGAFSIIPDKDAEGNKIQYRFVVEDFRRGKHQAKPGGKIPSCDKAMLTLAVYDDNDAKLGTIEQDLFLVRSLEWKLASFFRSLGFKKHGERYQPDWGKVKGAAGWLTVCIREWAKKDDPPGIMSGRSNEVDEFIDAEKVGQPGAAADPALGF